MAFTFEQFLDEWQEARKNGTVDEFNRKCDTDPVYRDCFEVSCAILDEHFRQPEVMKKMEEDFKEFADLMKNAQTFGYVTTEEVANALGVDEDYVKELATGMESTEELKLH